MKQFITRKGSIDCGHRVMNHAFACNNYHGHTYLYELHFGFGSVEDIGYAVDFKEIKRIGVQWMLDFLDHGFIANPKDKDIIKLIKDNGMKLWLMSINGKDQDCNPTAENIAKEIFIAMEILFDHIKDFSLYELVLYETPNNFTTCYHTSVSTTERNNFRSIHKKSILEYADSKGEVTYDVRKGKTEQDNDNCEK